MLDDPKLMEYGDNRFDVDDKEEVVEFFPDIGDKLKSYNFKKKKMWLLQYRTHDSRIVSVYYYYNARITDPKLPFSEKVDYVLHKDFDLTDNLRKNLRSIVKPTTKLVASDDDLIVEWEVPEKTVDAGEPIDTYDIRKDRDQNLFSVNINDYL